MILIARFVLTEVKLIFVLTFKSREQLNFNKILTLTEIVTQLPKIDIEVFAPVTNCNKTFRSIPTNVLFNLI